MSPIAHEQGAAASEALVARMRAAGLTDQEIAGFTARWHVKPPPDFLAPSSLAGESVGAVGIPTAKLPGIAANFGDTGVVYIIRVPQNAAIKAPQWGLSAENEWIILNQIPEEFIIQTVPAARIPALRANNGGSLIPAR